MRSLLSNGNPLNRTALVSVNTVALTPMPSASATSATTVSSGLPTRLLKPKRRSFNKCTTGHPQRESRSIDTFRHRKRQKGRPVRVSFVSQRHCRIDTRRSTRGKPHGDKGDDTQNQRNGDKDHRISRGDAEEKTREDPGEAQCRGKPDRDANQRQPHSLADDHIPYSMRVGSECETNADLLRPLLNGIGHQPVDANGGEQEC